MELIIEIDKIEDATKKEWLLSTLKLMGIHFHTIEKPQNLDEYNRDLEEGNAEIEDGKFISAKISRQKPKNGDGAKAPDSGSGVLSVG